MQDWLYDEGEDETKAVYVDKLKELEALGEPVLARAREAGARPGAAAALMSTANRLIQIASANDAKHAHIPQDEKEKVCLLSVPGAFRAQKYSNPKGLFSTARHASCHKAPLRATST